MLHGAKFIKNTDIIVEDRDSWRNMGFNDKSKKLGDKGGIPCFFKRFNVNKPIASARLEATALGLFDVFINGERVGERTESGTIYDELKPGWTDYSHRVFVFTYDVAHLLTEGENGIFAEVSCGWYSCRISFGIYGFKKPAFCARLTIAYTDGTKDVICTDESWQTALTGSVRTADIWDGEYYDAREKRTMPADAKNAEIEEYTGETVPRMLPRILVREQFTLTPREAYVFEGTRDNGTDFGEVNVKAQKEGEGCERFTITPAQRLVIDMAQNSVGRPRIHLSAKRGTKITVYFGEFLNDSGDASRGNDGAKGSVYVKNYRSALSRMVYVASGEGIEEYAARHTFFGYRYLEIETDGEAEIISVSAEIIGSANEETAEFSCSDEEVNRLWSNIVWGQRGNYLSIPTDCPQRDERLGWTGDTQIFCGAGSYIADIYDFMRKWLGDARDTQNEDGSYCDVIPKVFTKESFQGNAAWTDACIIVPYEMYKKYGRTEIISEHFASMERYMDFLAKSNLEGGNTSYGDWLCYEPTDKRYIAVCYYACDAMIMRECARILGKADRAEHYERLYDAVKAHFAERYIKDGDITEKTQTGYLLALRFGLLPHEMRENAKSALRKKIEDNDYTLSTGFVGTGILCTTLSDLGMNDSCYSLLLQTKDPSWLYSVRQGATTVWERWNSYTLEKGFGDVNMNSFNHYAYGAVAEWMMGSMAGIRAELPGFEQVRIAPRPDMREVIPQGQKRITHVRAAYRSVAGMIKSEWHITESGCRYEIEVPVDSVLDIELYCGSCKVNGDVFPTRKGQERLEMLVTAGKYIVEVSAALLNI